MIQIAFQFDPNNLQSLNDKLNEGWKVVSNLVYVSDNKHSKIVCVIERKEDVKQISSIRNSTL